MAQGDPATPSRPRADVPSGPAPADTLAAAGPAPDAGFQPLRRPGEREHFRWAVRIYWEDTDAGGVVFYANYLKLFERARTEWLRALGVGQQALRDATGLIFVVTETTVHYRAPARLDDEVELSVTLTEAGRVRMTLEQGAWRGGQRLAEGRIRIACIDATSLKPRPIPPELMARLPPLFA